MKHNLGTIDRALRIGAGTALIGLSIAPAIDLWGYLGIVPLLTGLLGACPAYALFDVSTCMSEDQSRRSNKP